jgi:hypothetical protein
MEAVQAISSSQPSMGRFYQQMKKVRFFWKDLSKTITILALAISRALMKNG